MVPPGFWASAAGPSNSQPMKIAVVYRRMRIVRQAHDPCLRKLDPFVGNLVLPGGLDGGTGTENNGIVYTRRFLPDCSTLRLRVRKLVHDNRTVVTHRFRRTGRSCRCGPALLDALRRVASHGAA